MLHARNLSRVTAAGLLAVLLALPLGGCPDDPYDASTWIDKLGDKNELERALTELGRLKDPKSIEPLGKAWRNNNHPARILRLIIDIADQFDPESDQYKNVSSAGARVLHPDDIKYIDTSIKDDKERAEVAKERYQADKLRTYGPYFKKGPFWEKAIPFLQEAVNLFLEDDNNDRLIENAIDAVDALGRAKEFGVNSDVNVIIKAATVQLPSNAKGQVVRIAALRALGKWSENPAAANTLIKVLNAKPEDQHQLVFAAAADALGHARSKDAVEPLMRAMFALPAVYPFCRRSLVAIGTPAIKPLIDLFTGKNKALNAFAREHKFNIDCDKAAGPKTKCIAPKALETKSALILGDLLAKQAVPYFLEELQKDAQPSGYAPNGRPFQFQHQAIFTSLRKMGANDKVANASIAYAKNSKSDDAIVPMAIDTYSFVATDTSQLGYLEDIMMGRKDRTGAKEKDADPSDPILSIASIAYGRLADKPSDLKPFKDEAHKHKAKADDWEKKFNKLVKEYDAAKGPYEKSHKEYLDKYVRPEIKKWDDAHASMKKDKPEEYAKERAKKPWFDTVPKSVRKAANAKKKKFEEIEFKKNDAENHMNEARGLQRTAEQNMARVLVGIQCKGKPKCYIDFVNKKPAELAKALAKDIPDAKDWDPDAQKVLWAAAVERSLLEIYKLGPKAKPVLPDLLRLLPSTERWVREGVLLALPQVAPLPCEECTTAMEAVIREQSSQTTLNALTAETRVAANWFSWAGTK